MNQEAQRGLMRGRARYLMKLVGLLLILDLFVFLYPPWIVTVIPNYYIHYGIWIPLVVALHGLWLYWAVTRWRRQDVRRPNAAPWVSASGGWKRS